MVSNKIWGKVKISGGSNWLPRGKPIPMGIYCLETGWASVCLWGAEKKLPFFRLPLFPSLFKPHLSQSRRFFALVPFSSSIPLGPWERGKKQAAVWVLSYWQESTLHTFRKNSAKHFIVRAFTMTLQARFSEKCTISLQLYTYCTLKNSSKSLSINACSQKTKH